MGADLNPFDLRGPEFLAFYLALIAVVTAAVWWVRRTLESGDGATQARLAMEIARDPYQMAFLSGGRAQVVATAIVSLIERGLLRADGKKLSTVDPDSAGKVRRPLDKAILTRYVTPDGARTLYFDGTIRGEIDWIGEALRVKGLLPDARITSRRLVLSAVAVGVLWLVAATKVWIAIQRGRTNIQFLIVLAIVSLVPVLAVSMGSRTALGDHALRLVRDTYTGLLGRKASLVAGATEGELAFLVAAFGMPGLPCSFTKTIWQLDLAEPQRGGGGAGGSGCSSCGGGGGCGGGGCGGGCGGCGG